MKVAYLTAGAAGMYCGSCLNDNTLARTLGQKGVDIALLPTYTPIRTDEVDVSMDRVFFGGINVYLQQKFAFFRNTPWIVDRLLNTRPLLKLASRLSGSTNARMLGTMTIAVLEGQHGPLRKELDKLVDWLKTDFQPDLVHLTNAMFVGLAGRIKDELDVPVTCGLPGEDLFLDALVEPYRSEAMEALYKGAQDIDAFLAPSQYYQHAMAAYMRVDPARIHYASMGLDMSQEVSEPQSHGQDAPFTIGFLARRAPEKGLHILLNAFKLLAQQHGKQAVALKVAGFLAPQNKAWYQGLVADMEAAGLGDRINWVGELDGAGKSHFFKDLHAFSMPASYQEPKGRSVLEALAHAVPVVQPNHGAFPHMLEQTGGGLLVQPGDPQALADGLSQLMDNEEKRLSLARQGRDQVRAHYTADQMAERVLQVWKKQLSAKDSAQPNEA